MDLSRDTTRGGRPQLIMHTLRDYVIIATEQDGCGRFGSEVYENAIVIDSNVDISLFWLSFQLLGLPSHYQTE